MRFSVELYGAHAFSAATHDELYAKIAKHHASRQKVVQFRIECRINEDYGSYVITDNHEDQQG